MPGQKDGWRDRQTLFFRTLPATAGGSNKSSRMWYSDMDKEVAALHETSLSLKRSSASFNAFYFRFTGAIYEIFLAPSRTYSECDGTILTGVINLNGKHRRGKRVFQQPAIVCIGVSNPSSPASPLFSLQTVQATILR